MGAECVRYLTIAKTAASELVIEKSRFICAISRASSEAEARSFIAAIAKKYWDASHNCTAYIIGERSQFQKSGDDGEPSGTAGVPMLDVLKKRSLTNTVAVVTRYFGGIKLGAGGLIRAYGKSVSAAADLAGTVAVLETAVLETVLDYASFKRAESQISKTAFTLLAAAFSDTVTASFSCAPADVPSLETWLQAASAGKALLGKPSVRLVEKELKEK